VGLKEANFVEERYNQQDGAPETRPDSAETVTDRNNARPATIGERSTEDKVAGQGLGQMKDKEPQHRAPGKQD
jgi:hypothetical protein